MGHVGDLHVFRIEANVEWICITRSLTLHLVEGRCGVQPRSPASLVVNQKPFEPTATLVGFCTMADLTLECELYALQRWSLRSIPSP